MIFPNYVQLTMLALALTGLAIQPASAGRSLPEPPTYYVLDESKALSDRALKALQYLLVEHAHASGEQILVAAFESAEPDGIEPLAQRAFSEWKLNRKGKALLLALSIKERKATVVTGFETTLPQDKADQILSDLVVPYLRAKQYDRAIVIGSVEILRALESPLISSGQTVEVLSSAGYPASFLSSPEPPSAISSALEGSSPFWYVALALFLALTAVGLLEISAAEAHFSAEGWVRHYPWRFWSKRIAGIRKPSRSASEERSALCGVQGQW